MILGNASISTLKLGSSAVQKVMLGATEVWSGFDADFAAYLAAGVANGSTMPAANQTAVNAFVVGCKADGIWSAIKASCILCAWDSLAGALTPLVGPAPTNVGPFVSGDYSRTTGLKGDGSTKSLSSNYAHNSDPQDNRSISVFITSPFANRTQRFIDDGGGVTTGGSHLRRSGTQNTTRLASSNLNSVTESAPSGLFGVSRSSSANYTRRVNGTSNTVTDTSADPTTTNYIVFGRGTSGVVTAEWSDARLSFYHMGESLDLALLDARLTTLMAALT